MYLYMGYPNTFKSHETVISENESNEEIIDIIKNNNLNDLVIQYAKLSAEIINNKKDNTYDIEEFAEMNIILYSEDGVNFRSNIDEPGKALVSIGVKTLPKVKYIQGERLDLTEGKITLTYENGVTQDIEMNNSEVSVIGYNINKLGEQTLTVVYKGRITTFKVEVKEKEVIDVKIYLPNKVKYTKGETLDLAGLRVVEIYDDGTRVPIEEGYKIEGYNSNKVGEQTIVISYKEHTSSYKIEVAEKNIDNIPSDDKEENDKVDNKDENNKVDDNEENKNESIGKKIETVLIIPPTKVNYTKGEKLDLTGLNITVVYSDNTIEKIEGNNLVKGYNKNKLGEQTLTISYKGFTRNYEIQVFEKQNVKDEEEVKDNNSNNEVKEENNKPIINKDENEQQGESFKLGIREILISIIVVSIIMLCVFSKKK